MAPTNQTQEHGIYTTFKQQLRPEHLKTDSWVVSNTQNKSVIGIVKWYGAWRKYCFFSCK